MRNTQPERWKCWREEKTKVRRLVRKKKKACWEKLLEENGKKNPSDVIRMAKSPSGTTERIKILKDKDGKEIPEKERGDAMQTAHFLWDEGRKEEEETIKGPGCNVEEMLE